MNYQHLCAIALLLYKLKTYNGIRINGRAINDKAGGA